MKKLFDKLLRLFIAAAVVFVSCGSAVTALADNGEVPAAIQYESSPFEGKGMFINCFDNADFPMKSPFVALSPEEQLEMMLDFAEKYGVRGCMITAVDLLRGIGVLAGLTNIDVPGATGNIDTNYRGKGEAAIRAFRDGADFVYIL